MDLNEKTAKTRAAVLDLYRQRCDGVAATCESPIEVALFWALLALGSEWGQPVVMDNREHDYGSWFRIPTELEDITLFPQHANESHGRSYRLDFHAQASTEAPTVTGEYQTLHAKAAIECDGHDFHERTKEQAARDRRRDRDLQADGYIILRFTGSEIARDAEAVATEIVNAINARLQAAFGAAHDAWRAAQGKGA